MNAAIYARRSDDQSERSEDAKSITRQVERARAYAAKRGWRVDDSHIFLDDGIRGAEFAKRQGYMRLLNAVKPRAPFEVLILSELSRLGREQLETGYAAKLLSQAGVRIFSYLDDREVLLTTPTDKFLMSAVNFAAEIEREKARQRVTDAMSRKAVRGHACGGSCYGYRNVEVKTPDGRRSHVDRQIDEPEAAVVRHIFAMCAAGHGLKGITKQLNAEAQPAPRPSRGRPRGWTPSTVRTVLFRDLYRGIHIWNKRRQTDAWGQRACQHRPESEWIRAQVPHLRIVSDDEWAAAHQRLDTARKTYERTNQGQVWGRPPSTVQSKYLLSGLMRCNCCGASMTVRSGSHGLGCRFFYICTTYDHRGASICDNGLRLPLTLADDAILSKLSRYVLDPDVVEGAIADAVKEFRPASDTFTTKRAALESEVRKLETEQSRLAAAIAVAGEVNALADAIREREAQRQRLRAELSRLDSAEHLGTFDPRRIRRDLRQRLAEWRDLLQRQTPLARQFITHLLDGRIAWTPRKDRGVYEFAGRVKFDELFTGMVLTQGLVPVRGFEPRSRG